MAELDILINALSDVVQNRPRPLREYDQIYMKTADMLSQVRYVCTRLDESNVIFIGDGDAIGLSLVHLKSLSLIPAAPSNILVLDFDERIVNSINRFAKENGLSSRISAQLYNVCDPLPENLWGTFNAFYTNPPYGQSNGGKSIQAFIERGLQATTGTPVTGCVVCGDHPKHKWTRGVMRDIQHQMINQGFYVSDFLARQHHYHLDDAPDLTSSTMVLEHESWSPGEYDSKSMPDALREDFYGKGQPLKVRYVLDETYENKYEPNDIAYERYED